MSENRREARATDAGRLRAFQAVAVPAGIHEIEFSHWDLATGGGNGLSSLAALLLAALLPTRGTGSLRQSAVEKRSGRPLPAAFPSARQGRSLPGVPRELRVARPLSRGAHRR